MKTKLANASPIKRTSALLPLAMSLVAQNQSSSGNEAFSPVLVVGVGVGIILLVSFIAYYFRHRYK